MIYEIKRGNTVVWSGKAIGAQYRKIMQEDRVEVEINSPSTLAFKKGDSIVVYGRTYKINRPTNITRKNTQVGYAYNIEFEALYYDLGKWGLFTLDKNNNLTERNVYLMSDAKTLLGLALQNANRASSGWSLGVIDDTEVFQWSFSSAKILSALQEVADKTGLELWFDDKTINLTRRQPNTGLKLEYGKGNELYELYRTRRDNPVVTHLYITGGSRNIPNNYGYSNIQPTGGNPLVNPNYSPGDDIVEDFHVYDNIYPRLNASVTTVISENVIRSSDIDFDLNDHLLDNGLPAQIVFTSGQLVGFTFTISENGYNHATRQVTFNKIVDDPAYPDGVPSNLLKPAVGDSFVFLQIDMPQVYVTGSENKVLDIGNSYFADNGIEQYNWSCKPIPRFLLEQEVELILGGIVNLKATDIGYNGNIRIDSYVRDLQKAHRYEFTLSNIIGISEFARERNKSDKLADTVTRNLGDGGLQINTTYAEKAGYAERAGRADIATHAATADTAGHANTADLATHSLTANHANTSDLATRALRADIADNSILWNGLAQPNYLTQPVRATDKPRFEGVGSSAFASGFSGHGYRLEKDSNGDYLLELDRLSVRKDFNVHELIVNQIRGTNGSIWVSDAIKITSATVSGANFICGIDTDEGTIAPPFVANDIVRCQKFNGKGIKYYTARVISVTASSFTITKLEGASNPASGDELVRIGNTTNVNRQGALYLTASDNGAPFLDVIDGVTSASLANKTKVRLGKLDGIVDANLGALSGYGIYAQSGYFTGKFHALSGSNVYNKSETQAEISNAEGRINLEVNTKIDAIQIGGRNLFTIASFEVGNIQQGVDVNGNLFWRTKNDSKITVNGGDNYSFAWDTEYSISSLCSWYDKDEEYINGNWTSDKNSFVLTAPVNAYYFRIAFRAQTSITIGNPLNAFSPSMERGNKPPQSWSPAPEDVDSDINAVQSSVTNLAITVDGHTQQIGLRATKTEVTTAQNNAINTSKNYTDGQVQVVNTTINDVRVDLNAANASIALKADRSVTDGLDTRLNNAEAKITPDAINFTVSSQIDTKVGNVGIWSKIYSVNTATSRPLTEADGSQFDKAYTYEVTAKVLNTSTVTTSIAVFKPNGANWELLIIKELGNGINHPEFFLNNGVPSIRLYGHTQIYSVDVRHEKSIGVDNNITATRSSFNMTDNNISLLGQTINLTGLITFQATNAQNAANAAQGTANTANTKATNAQSAADAANTAALDAAGIANGKGKVIYAASAPTSSTDRNANNLWIRTSDNKPHRWTGSAWSAVTDKVATDAAAAANTANNNLASLQGSLKSMAYEDKVNLAKLDNSIVEGGYFKTTLIDVQDVFAQTVTATNLTVSGSSKIAGFKVVGNSLENANTTASLKFNDISGAGYLRINEQTNSPLLNIRTDTSSRTGISVQTYGSGTTGLYIINNANTGMSGGAIRSYGSHGFYQRQNEYWSAPGVLAAATLTSVGGIISSWNVVGISVSGSKSGLILTVTHNLGHTDYVVMYNSKEVSTTPVINSNNFTINVGTSGYVEWFMMIGRNKVITS